jgi:hypothetical protein
MIQFSSGSLLSIPLTLISNKTVAKCNIQTISFAGRRRRGARNRLSADTLWIIRADEAARSPWARR